MKTFLPSRVSFSRLLSVPGTLLLLASLSTGGTYARTPSELNSPKYNPVNKADRTLTGRVTDEKNEGLPGVSVILKGTSRGTVTDVDGQYKLEVPNGSSTLVFSFVGYLSKEVQVGNQASINVNLQADSKVLDEIVVIGYGTSQNLTLLVRYRA